MGMESTGESRRRPAEGDSAPAAGGGRERCPRCESRDTKFCYYNNYNMSQPRHFCKCCRRYWTLGGALRNVPIGGASRKRFHPWPNPAECRPGRNLPPPPLSGLVGLSSDLPAGHGSLLPGGAELMRLDEPFLPGLGLGLGIGCGSGAAEEMASFGLGHGMLWGTHSLLDESGDAWRVGSGVGGVDYFVTSGPATSGVRTDLAVSEPADAGGAPVSDFH
ncbi:dof zinc finger protein DOF1.7-like [Zingiber officinale]|uniref:Dof-type domain-containing protein n=1 Tax=Zingiber officinale TaxID=94328 RepID=A0A8J5KCU8_ZINOF|nr:dof zinc finger protein DOF1.7-like [Zingiber officinale]KAG6475653.1 hypothetical protein ZIOFF_064882 [Zingiber officinale]